MRTFKSGWFYFDIIQITINGLITIDIITNDKLFSVEVLRYIQVILCVLIIYKLFYYL
jgi:hypothetical protein